MAKRGRKKGSRKARARKSTGKTVGMEKFAGHTYRCYGKRVKSGKSKKKSPRVYCGRTDK